MNHIKAVIYARYSSDSQNESSIEGQLRECNEYAEKQGYSIVGTYIDRALIAKTDNRPEFQKMIRDSAKKQFDIVLIWKLDRFARNRLDSATYRAILKRNGVWYLPKKAFQTVPRALFLNLCLRAWLSIIPLN